MESLHFKEEEERKMEEEMISNTTHPISSTSTPWKLYHNPLYSHHPDPSLSDLTFGAKSIQTELEEAKAQINDLKAEISRIKSEIDEEKKMMRVAEVFREGKFEMNLGMDHQEKALNKKLSISYNERRGGSNSPEPENPHIKRGIKGSVEFQRVVKAMCSNKSNKQFGGNYKLECQKAQLKILLKQKSRVRPDNLFIT